MTIARPESALVVTPHPDDAELGCGGTVARWAKEGTKVTYVLCTNGDKGSADPETTSERLAVIREKEQAEAARVLGAKEVIYLKYPDGELEDTKEFRGKLVWAIRKFRPDVVFCTDPHRRGFYLHRDHRISGQVTLDAVFPYARDHLHYPEHKREGLQPHKVADVLMWGTEEPNAFIDIADTIEQKVKALKMHASQVFGDGTADLGEFVKASARRMGQRAELPYAEGFRRIQFRR